MILESSLSTVKKNMILYACCFSFWCHILKPQGLENVDSVSAYDQHFEIDLYTFEKNGLLYTFYFSGAGESEQW